MRVLRILVIVIPLAFAATGSREGKAAAFLTPLAPPPHVPQEEDWERQQRGEEPDRRDYQDRSVQRVKNWAWGTIEWVLAQLAAVELTPERIALVLGLVGALVTRNRNKQKTKWAILTGLSYLLLILGGAGIALKLLG